MQSEEEPVEISVEVEGGAESSPQSEEDHWSGLHMGDVIQLTQGLEKKRMFAIYYRHGHVIHSWSPSRQNFRVRIDSLRTLKHAGYTATECSTKLDTFFMGLLALTPVAPEQVVQRAKMVLHATTTSSSSNLTFILFARYGEKVFELLKTLKEAYCHAYESWIMGLYPSGSLSSKYLFGAQPYKTLLDAPLRREDHVEDKVELSRLQELPIKAFFQSCGEYLIGEWLKKSLSDFFTSISTPNCWYPICVPPASGLTPLFMMFDKDKMAFSIRFQGKGGLAERMAGDRMECGICWMDLTLLKVVVMKCSHYICAPCLRMLSRRVCPYCREPIRYTVEVTEHVKQDALRLMLTSLALDNSLMAIADATELETELHSAGGSVTEDRPDPVSAAMELVDEPEHHE